MAGAGIWGHRSYGRWRIIGTRVRGRRAVRAGGIGAPGMCRDECVSFDGADDRDSAPSKHRAGCCAVMDFKGADMDRRGGAPRHWVLDFRQVVGHKGHARVP